MYRRVFLSWVFVVVWGISIASFFLSSLLSYLDILLLNLSNLLFFLNHGCMVHRMPRLPTRKRAQHAHTWYDGVGKAAKSCGMDGVEKSTDSVLADFRFLLSEVL